MSNAKGVGRPSTTDPDVIIERLINRYPNGSPFSSADELFAANPDLASKKKNISKQRQILLGYAA